MAVRAVMAAMVAPVVRVVMPVPGRTKLMAVTVVSVVRPGWRVRVLRVRLVPMARRGRVTGLLVARVVRAVTVAVVVSGVRLARRLMVVLPVLPGRWVMALPVLLAVRAVPVVPGLTRRV